MRCTAIEEDGRKCQDKLLAKGLCQTHYNRKRATGSINKTRRANAGRTCDREGCDRQPVGNGLCRLHYQEKWRASRRADREAGDTRTCESCGGPMAGKTADARFCSRTCKDRNRVSEGRAAKSSAKWHFKQKYGLTLEQVEEMAKKGCSICGTTDWPGRHNRPSVDHDHKTGRVRGVLCSECNYGLGKFKDDPQLLAAAIEYLNRSERRPAA